MFPYQYFNELREGAPESLIPLIYQLEDQWDRKLWHQVTVTLVEIFALPESAPFRINLYNNLISKAEDRLNKLALVGLAISASEEFSSLEKSLEFMNDVAKKADKDDSREEHVFAQLKVASIHLQLNQVYAAKKVIDGARKVVDELPISDKSVLSQFYGVSCEYFKKQGDFTSYYRNALLYLACIDSSKVPKVVLQQRAYDLCVAALLAPKIYNFGELVLHRILDTLGSEHAWLRDLVIAVNEGNVPHFQELRPEFSSKSPMLAAALPFLEQKICLMALCECVFKRQQVAESESSIPFSTIAKETSLQSGAKVEVLCMKAFSLGLMRGKIDEVTKTVEIDWLQPRVLSREQTKTMRERLGEWDHNVKELGEFMKEHGQGLWQEAA